MGCDQSKDEIKITDYDDFGEEFIKETDKKVFCLYQKDYFFWVWTANTQKNTDLLAQAAELWMPFPVDISKNIENAYIARDNAYILKSKSHKLVFEFEKKLLTIFNAKINLESEINESNSININDDRNTNNINRIKNNLSLYAENLNDDVYESNILYILKIDRIKVPSASTNSTNEDLQLTVADQEKEKENKTTLLGEKETLNQEENQKVKEIEAATEPKHLEQAKGLNASETENKNEEKTLNLLKCFQDPTAFVSSTKENNDDNKPESNDKHKKDITDAKDPKKSKRFDINNKQEDTDLKEALGINLLTLNDGMLEEKDLKDPEADKKEESFVEYFTLHSEIKLASEKEEYDFFTVYKPEENNNSAINNNYSNDKNNKNFYKSNSNEETNFSLNSSFERKTITSVGRFSRSYSFSKIETQKNLIAQSSPNIIYISDLFSKVHLFGLYDMPLFFNPDFIKYLRLKIPKNIFTLNELKEFLISEIGKEAKALANARFDKKQTEKNSSENPKSNEANGKPVTAENTNTKIISKLFGDLNSCEIENVKNSWVFKDDREAIQAERANEEVKTSEANFNMNIKSNDSSIQNHEDLFEELASYRDQADVYTNLIKQIDKDNICQIILHVYSIKGFVNKRFKFMLKQKFTDKSHLIGFLVILMGVMKCDGINNFFGYFYPRNLVFEEPNNKKRFIRLYKEIECELPVVCQFIEKIEKEKNKFYERIRERYTYLYDKAVVQEEKMEYDEKFKKVMESTEFISKDFLITDEILSLTCDQSSVFQHMQNRNLLIIDLDIDIIKNNPSILSFINMHNYFPNKPEIALIPGCALAYKNITIDPINDLNIIHLEFIGNFFNPYDHIKFSNEPKIKFTELHVENQKNKFPINQDKILEYFSEALMLNKSLKELDISDNRLNEVLFGKLVSSLKSQFNLNTLNITNNNLGENSAVYLNEILENNFFLENLIMSNIHFKNEGLKTISDNLMKNKILKSFDVSNNFLTYDSAEILRNFLMNNSSLEKLNLSENNITDEKGENPLNEALKYNMKLEEIDFSNCDFNGKTISTLFENLKENFSLKKLILSKNKLNEEDVITLWESLSNYEYSSLKHLGFAGINLSEKACERIADNLKTNNYLNTLDLSNNSINDNSMKLIFEALKHNVILSEIDLRFNKCGKEVLFILSNLLLNDIKIKKILVKGNFKEEEENLAQGFSFLSNFIKTKNVQVDISEYLN